ncbi:MAG: hypothetical protein PHS98_04680 [Bacilli bacterium]|nr:hypothetical protein [Bacilli bacterium]
MKNWEKFEQQCCDYLNKYYGSQKIRFQLCGKSNANDPDILVIKNNVNIFNMEVKMPNAQSGQFVVKNIDAVFVFSEANKSDAAEAEAIIEHMNENYELYENVSTSSIPIEMEQNEFAAWIINHYLSKNEKYLITHNSKNFIILPIEKYQNYFNIEANYRIKKSGSSDVSKKNINEIEEYFSGLGEDCDFTYNGEKFYLNKPQMVLHEEIHVGKYDYSVREVSEAGSYIRRLGNTKNANVIFNIALISDQDDDDLDCFINDLNNEEDDD